MPATHFLATEDPHLLESWRSQLPPGRPVLLLADVAAPATVPPGVPVVVVLDAALVEKVGGKLDCCPTVIVGEPRSQPYEQARMTRRAQVYLSYEQSESRLSEYLPLLEELAERNAAVDLLMEKTRRTESAPPIPRVSPWSNSLEIWDFIEGAVENLGSRERLLAEFRRATRYLLRASHAVFFLRETGGFRADRGESFCALDDPIVGYLSQHPAVLDGMDWPGPSDPVAELAVRHRLALWGARLLVPLHENGRLLGMIAFGVRDDGQPYDSEGHGRAVFLARLLRHFLSQSSQINTLREHYEQTRLGERYLPRTLVLGADEVPPKQVPVVVRAVVGEARKFRETRRVLPSPGQPFRASAGIIGETGGTWVVWEEASSEVSDQNQRTRSDRLELLRELALTLNHEIGNALVSLSTLGHGDGTEPPPPDLLAAARSDIKRLQSVNQALVGLSSLSECECETVDLRTMLQALGKKCGLRVEVGPEPVKLAVSADLLDFALESLLRTVIENRSELGTKDLALQLRSTGEGSDRTALISIKGKQLELEGVLPSAGGDGVPNQGRIGVFIAREVIRLHAGEIHAGPGLEGTEILLSISAWQ